MYDYILFDLDGTLTDPFEGITNSIIYALKKFGIEVSEKQKLKCFIGPPLYKSFSEYCGLSQEDSEKAVAFYREYFSQRGLYENKPYDGTQSVLQRLKDGGKKLIVATSKPQIFAERILDHFNLSRYFDYVSGATLDSSRVEKSDIIAFALKNFAVSPQNSVMVGDRKHDIIGAKANGLKSVGVLYGYGDESELLSAGADYIATMPKDIIKIVDRH